MLLYIVIKVFDTQHIFQLQQQNLTAKSLDINPISTFPQMVFIYSCYLNKETGKYLERQAHYIIVFIACSTCRFINAESKQKFKIITIEFGITRCVDLFHLQNIMYGLTLLRVSTCANPLIGNIISLDSLQLLSC